MTPDRLSSYWRHAGQLLGFAVEAPCHVVLPGGKTLTFAACLPDFGAERGMLLSDDYECFSAHAVALAAAGYGYSVLSAPTHAPVLADVVDLLQDWGWSASGPRPEWLNEA